MKKSKLLPYFLETERIKDVKRYGKQHMFYRESVGDHSFMMILMAQELIEIFDLDLNFEKVIKIISYHDMLVELGLEYDFDALTASRDPEYVAKKEAYEKQNVKRLASKYGNELKEIFKEYQEQKTPEARFVKALDKMESCLHKMARDAGKHCESVEFDAVYANKAVKNFPQLIPFYKKLQKEMKRHYTKSGHLWKDEYNLGQEKTL